MIFWNNNLSLKIFRIFLIAIIYYCLAILGLHFGIVIGNISPVWPAAGLLVAATYLYGYPMAIFGAIGGYLAMYQTGIPILSTLFASIAAIVEAMLAAFFIKQWISPTTPFNSAKNVLKYLVLVGVIATAIGSFIGVTAICYGQPEHWQQFWLLWFTWLLGDMLGVLVFAPAIIAFNKADFHKLSKRSVAEFIMLMGLVIAINSTVFSGVLKLYNFHHPEYLCIPLVIVAAIRFRQLGATITAIITSVIAIFSTAKGIGPFADPGNLMALLQLQLFIAILTLSGLVLAAVIADLNQTQESLHEAQQRFHRAVKGTSDALWEWNIPTKELWYSPTLCDLLGYPPNELEIITEESWTALVHPEDLAITKRILKRAVETSRNFDIKYRLKMQDHTFRWFRNRGGVYYDENDKPSKIAGSIQDIHELEMTREHLKQAKELAEAANLSKTTFLANISHEIRTPLSAILGYSEMLEQNDLPTNDKVKFLSLLKRNCHHLYKLIDNVIDLSKVEAGLTKVEVIKFDLLDEIKSVLSIVRIKALEKNLDLQVNFKTSVPKVINSDPTLLRQILINVLGNAIKFTNQGMVSLWLELRTDQNKKQKQLVFTVIDQGSGIKVEYFHKIFQPFSQIDTSMTRLFNGKGLGLALSKNLARLLGGDIILKDSVIDVGSTFEIVIEPGPLQNCELVNSLESGDEKIIIEQRISTKLQVNHQLNGLKVLLVEDGEDNQILIEHILKSAGAQVKIAHDGQEGVRKALKDQFGVVLMDIQMPRLDGYEATSKLRELGCKTPVIALTAYATNHERDRCIAAGCNDYRSKPIDARTLIEIVAKWGFQNRKLNCHA